MATHSWVWENGKFRELGFISVEDRGFRYGMSVFETIAVIGGRAVLTTEHLCRLELAAVQLEFPIDPSAMQALLDFLEHPLLNEGLLRVHWTAGDGGPADPLLEGRLIVRCEEMSLLPGGTASIRDVSVVSIQTNLSEWDSWKTGNYMKRCRLLAEARKRGATEALLWDDEWLVSAVMANVFLVNDSGELVTPQLRPGCRNGTVREWVMNYYEVKEQDIAFREMLSTKEMFLTNSRLGIASVKNLEGRELEEGKLSKKVEESYREFLLSHVRRP